MRRSGYRRDEWRGEDAEDSRRRCLPRFGRGVGREHRVGSKKSGDKNLQSMWLA